MKDNNTGWSVVNGKDMRYAKIERHNKGVASNCMDIVNLCASIEDAACAICEAARSEKRQAVYVNDEVGEMLATFTEMLAEAVEALPFIQKFRNSLVVIKCGGSIMEDPELVKSAMCDVVLLEAIGIRPIVVHGGGKAISAELKRQEIPVKFVNGLRYTDDRTIGIVDDVLHNVVNANLVKLGENAGGKMCGISGKSVLRAERTYSTDPVTGKSEDIGFVGKVSGVDVSPILEALENNAIPVVTPLGTGSDGQVYNINADTAAAKIAGELGAEALISMTDISGILRDKNDPNTLIPVIKVSEAPELVKDGTINGGMIPKVECCINAIHWGVRKVFIIDGRVPHAILIETLTNEGIGTMFINE